MMASVAQSAGSIDSPLLKERDEVRRVAEVVITSDRGLAGAYNTSVIRAAERDMRAHGKETRLFSVGKKGLSYFKFRGYDISQSWQGFSDRPLIDDARQVADAVVEAYLSGEVDQVRLGFTRFESMLRQVPVVVQLLPMPQAEFQQDDDRSSSGPSASYEFEPSPEDILDLLLPRYVEGTILQAMLEAAASEHAARRRAMKAATDNADDLIQSLNRVYNQARQAEITTEIMEVIGGAEALSDAGN